MIQALAVLVGIGVILSIITGLPGLLLLVPAMVALFFVLRKRQTETPVDHRFTGGAQPDQRTSQYPER
ncbi:MAG TPA: hypothetical protein VM307_15440 [Egibacteraceae bacterium]|nr:hypothetical protein [Egibacteraceae bacterium]